MEILTTSTHPEIGNNYMLGNIMFYSSLHLVLSIGLNFVW